MGARRIAIELAGEDVGSRVVVRPGRAWPVGGLGIGAGHAVPLHDPVDAAPGERHAPCPRACLIFPAPYTLPLSRGSARKVAHFGSWPSMAR